MTLLVNEFHISTDLRDSILVQVADQRITVNGVFHSHKVKVFRIPSLNASIGYFGLAQLNSHTFISDWLPVFISRNSDAKTISDFALRLKLSLESSIDKGLLRRFGSGFHLSGFEEDKPVLWFVRNIGAIENGAYVDFRDKFEVSEDFLARDARLSFGYDGESTKTITQGRMFYANGDLRAFQFIWRKLDEAVTAFSSGQIGEAQVERIARWKMKVVGNYYRNFERSKIIGGPVNAVTLRRQSSNSQ